ncbi:hypothetical protein [Streptomyces sp. NPDC090112]
MPARFLGHAAAVVAGLADAVVPTEHGTRTPTTVRNADTAARYAPR